MYTAFAYTFAGLTFYQVTLNQAIRWNEQSEKRLEYQIRHNTNYNKEILERLHGIDPKAIKHEKCIYWEGEDITIDDATTIAESYKKRATLLKKYSPMHQFYAHVKTTE